MDNQRDATISSVCKRIESATGLNPAPILNLMNAQAHSDLADYLGISYASLENLVTGEPDHAAAELFELKQSDLDNLYSAYGSNFGLAMLVGMLAAKRTKSIKNDRP